MRLVHCDLCRIVISQPDVIELETCSNDNKGLSLEICPACESDMRVIAEKNFLEILLEGELK